jgi:putative transcriptional regulator
VRPIAGKFDPSLPVAFRLAKLFNLKIEEVFLDDQ